MEKVRGRRRLDRGEFPRDLNEHIAKHLPNVQEDKVINFIYDMRYARTSDICKYLGLSLYQTRNYLRGLYLNWYLFRKFKKVDKGSSEGYYYLDKASVLYLATNAGMTIREFGWDNRYNISDPERMDHTLDITAIRVALHSACRDQDVSLDKFHGEKRVGLRRIDENKSINPDGEFALIVTDHGQKFIKKYFLEYDRGTEDLLKIKEKVAKYYRYYQSEDCSERYDKYPPDLLFVCNGDLSEKRVRVAIDGQDDLLKLCRVVLVQKDVLMENPLAKVYEDLESKLHISLVDL
jgi:hypothetical protein